MENRYLVIAFSVKLESNVSRYTGLLLDFDVPNQELKTVLKKLRVYKID